MALRKYMIVFCLLLLVTLVNSFSMKYAVDRLNALETRFETENKLRRSETEELFRMVSELAGGKILSRSEHVSPDETITPSEQLTTKSPSADKYKTTELAIELQDLKSYIKGVAAEKQQSVKLRSDLRSTSKKLEDDYTMFESRIKEEIRNFTNDVSDKLTLLVSEERLNNLSDFLTTRESELRNEARQSLILLKSDVETSIQKLSSNLQTVNITAIKSVERCNNVSESLTIVTNERLNNLSAFVTTTQSELRNESRQSLISLKSDVEKSNQKLTNDFQTVNVTAIKSLERFNNLMVFVTTTQSEFRNEARQSLISLKSDVETSIQKLSNNFQTVNVTAIKSVEHCNNVSDSLTIVTNERLINLSASVTKTQSELRNEARQSLISLKSDVETSIQKLSNDLRKVKQTAMKNVERYSTVSDSFRIVSNDLRRVNQSAMENVERCNNVSDSLTIVTNGLRRVKNILKPIESCRNATKSGDYDMYIAKSATTLPVYCDQETDGGGWLVIQRRKDGSVDFERTWADYKIGFGDIENEFWIGNDNLHALTSSGLNELLIDMEDFEGNKTYAKYSIFKVHRENELYRLEVGGYSGNAGNSLTSWHTGMPFSTKDRDNDKWANGSCSEYCRGAWWYNVCGHSNLNGYYYHGGKSPGYKGIYWQSWKGWYYSLKTVEMKIR